MSKKNKKQKHLSHITVDPNMPDFSKDPYFVQKNERAKAFLEKHPIPEEMLAKSKKNK